MKPYEIKDQCKEELTKELLPGISFEGLPVGTAGQVVEDTPEGWQWKKEEINNEAT